MSQIRRPLDDEELRRAWAGLSQDATFGPTCPEPDRLWSAARGESAPGDVEELAIHVATCGACAEAWRLAREFDAPAPEVASGSRWWPILAAAAVVALAVGVSLYFASRTAPPPPPIASNLPAVPPPPSFLIPVDKPPIRVSTRYALTWRGAGDGHKFLEALNLSLEPYRQGDYREAAERLAALGDMYPDTAEPRFYQGVSLLLAGDAAAAIGPLERARNRAEADQLDDARWYLAAAYERASRRDDARALLKPVCDAGGARSAPACAALNAAGAPR